MSAVRGSVRREVRIYAATLAATITGFTALMGAVHAAEPSECIPEPNQHYNSCATLDPSQVRIVE